MTNPNQPAPPQTDAEVEQLWRDQWDATPSWKRAITTPFIFAGALVYLAFRSCYVVMNHIGDVKP